VTFSTSWQKRLPVRDVWYVHVTFRHAVDGRTEELIECPSRQVAELWLHHIPLNQVRALDHPLETADEYNWLNIRSATLKQGASLN
jgi:hypothetical protein